MKTAATALTVAALLAIAAASVVSTHSSAILPHGSARELTYDHTPDDFSCAIENDANQTAAFPDWDYARVAPDATKQPLARAWEPLLERVPGCTGLDAGWTKKFWLLVVLDASWIAYYEANKALFAGQGYGTLQASPFVMIDRVSYLYEKQFGVKLDASAVVPLPGLLEACETNNKRVDDGSDDTNTLKQLAAAGISPAAPTAAVLRLGTGSASGVFCHSEAEKGALCDATSLVNIILEPFSNGVLRYRAPMALAHELAVLFGFCTSSAHCLNELLVNEFPDIMVYERRPGKVVRPTHGQFYKFLTTCSPLYRDELCGNVRTRSCGVDVAPPTITGSYFCTACSVGRARRRYVTVTEVVRNKVYRWRNRRGAVWKLTRDPNNADLFNVEKRSPQYRRGYTVARVRKEIVGGMEKVTGIYGPRDELFELV